MKAAISGASGLIGSALRASLARGGHEVSALVRRAPRGADEIAWDPQRGTIDAGRLEGLDAVVHLAGEGIASGRWSAARMERIRSSRERGTALVAGAVARLARKPRVLLCASAIGYYGDRGEEWLDESSSQGRGFLAGVCAAWEAAADPARAAGVRVVHLRFGVVLSAAGGALARMLLPFRLGVGGRLGSGRQYMSWITLDDALAALQRVLASEELRGAVNAVSPGPVTNAEFTAALGRALHRPAVLPVPAFALRLALGGLADEALLASARVRPRVLEAAGHAFLHPQLDGALQHVLAAR
jgi:uncharacterized protein (TIGR01777 family)